MTSDSRKRLYLQDPADVVPTIPHVDGYRIERLVGEGGFGQVWRASRDADSTAVAIKVLHLELIRSNDALTRFDRELQAIERLDHRNVVRAYDHGALSDGRPYLVLEFIEGPSLRDALHDRGALPPAEMLAILEPLCDALGCAHERGIVHRDIKASNVILSRDARGERPVMLDFGLVKLLDHGGPSLTSSRSMLGTPAAMAPEQMKGLPVDARTDVYALGLLAYHMLTGVPAFGSTPGVVQSYLQVHGPRPRPSAKVDIDPAFDEPIARALAPEPKDRYANAREFIEALRALICPDVAAESDVVALYAEGDRELVARVVAAARDQGMIVALAAPDSILAVAFDLDVATVQAALQDLGDGVSVALGPTRATISGDVVDGPALDVEAWAPYPLSPGLWVAPRLR